MGALEPLFNEYGVDLVFNGHCHTYERMHPVTNWEPNECGPTYITMGDGGNYESIEPKWYDLPESDKPPVWSAFREASFGVGSLHIKSKDEAQYNWNRHACAIGDPAEKKFPWGTSKFFGKGTKNTPMFDDDTKGFGTDYNGASCQVGTTANVVKPGTSGSQDSKGGDSVRLKSKVSLGCPIRGREPTTSNPSKGTNKKKSTATDGESESESAPTLGKVPASVRDPSDSNTNTSSRKVAILLGVLIPVGFLGLAAAFLFDQKNGGTWFGAFQTPPTPFPVTYGDTEKSLQL